MRGIGERWGSPWPTPPAGQPATSSMSVGFGLWSALRTDGHDGVSGSARMPCSNAWRRASTTPPRADRVGSPTRRLWPGSECVGIGSRTTWSSRLVPTCGGMTGLMHWCLRFSPTSRCTSAHGPLSAIRRVWHRMTPASGCRRGAAFALGHGSTISVSDGRRDPAPPTDGVTVDLGPPHLEVVENGPSRFAHEARVSAALPHRSSIDRPRSARRSRSGAD